MNTFSRAREHGRVSGSLIAIIALIVVCLAFGSAAIWSYLNYNEQKTNVDGKIDLAVAEGKKEQADQDEAKFAEREKEPLRDFVGPDDYGRVTFKYPKTWSAYVAKDVAKGGTYEAYLNPGVVPPVSTTQQVALRVTILESDYDRELARYDGLVKKGDLKSSAVAINGQNGTRLDGNFTKAIRGSMVLFKLRDKTLTLRTDANTFKPDFDKLIKTLEFNT